jgi:hypothetical protein
LDVFIFADSLQSVWDQVPKEQAKRRKRAEGCGSSFQTASCGLQALVIFSKP